MEIDGQSGEVVSTEQNEFEKFTALHPGHFARHISTVTPNLLQVRGSDAIVAFKRTF
jgi:hypothetical protein